jgi:adenylate kinase
MGKFAGKIFIFLGAPGSGKGTQAKKLMNDTQMVQLSTGDMLREEMRNKTELGNTVKNVMNRGELVTDDLIIDLVKARFTDTSLIGKGIVLDGFPRTVAQADLLDSMLSTMRLEITKVVLIDVELQSIVTRISGRRICKECEQVYHTTFMPSEKPDNCDKCNGSLYQREDDTEEKVQFRYKVYKEQTAPLTSYYQDKLVTVNGEKKPDEIYEQILELCSNI